MRTSRYNALNNYLASKRNQGIGRVRLSMRELNQLVPGGLPPSATDDRSGDSWWGNDRTHTQAYAWMDAGYKVEPVSSWRSGEVCFRRDDA